MYITFKQLFKLKTLRGAKLISGRGRLFNLIRGCEIIDSLPFNGTIKEDVLLIIKYAPDIKGKTEDFLELVKKAAEKKAAGIVINAGRFTVRIPQSVMEEANKRIFPFISVSRTTAPEQLANEVYKKLEKNEVKREKIGRLLDYVLTYDCRPGDKKELIHYGYIPKLRYQAVSAKIIFKDDTKDEEKSKYTETVMEIIREAFEAEKKKILYVTDGIYLLFFCPVKDYELSTYAREITVRAFKRTRLLFPEIKFLVGVGCCVETVDDLADSREKADEVVSYSESMGRKLDIQSYDDMVLYNLCKTENKDFLMDVIEKYLGELSENQSLLDILEALVKSSYNKKIAAKNSNMCVSTLEDYIELIDAFIPCRNLKFEEYRAILRAAIAIRNYLMSDRFGANKDLVK